jgi:hypothetical protein
MPRFCLEVAGAGLARPGGLGQGTSDLRVMSQSRGSGTLQRTGCQINPTLVLEFSSALWITWTDQRGV